jgi:hypothetical protein
LTGKGMQSLREGSLAETSGSGSLRELEPGPRGNFGDSSALSRRKSASEREKNMAVNKPTGDNARKGAVKKRSQTKSTLGGTSAWTKRNRNSGEFMALKRPGKKKKAAKKFKGVRVERSAAKTRTVNKKTAAKKKSQAARAR